MRRRAASKGAHNCAWEAMVTGPGRIYTTVVRVPKMHSEIDGLLKSKTYGLNSESWVLTVGNKVAQGLKAVGIHAQ